MSASNNQKREISPALREYTLICWRIFERLQREKEEQKENNK